MMLDPRMRSAVLSCVFLVVASAAPAEECADEQSVQGFTVRSVRVAARYSRVPQTLDQELAQHRGEVYSSDMANRYAEQVKTYLGRSASQLEDEVFGLNALRALSIKAGLYQA